MKFVDVINISFYTFINIVKEYTISTYEKKVALIYK